jgi:levanase
VFLDRSSVELLGNDGRVSITDQIFPSAGSNGVALYATGGTAKLVSLDVWELQSIWKTARKR